MSANVKKSPFFKTTVFAIAFTFFVCFLEQIIKKAIQKIAGPCKATAFRKALFLP
jgi:hypothetical protein